ncbi:MAG TPA: TetR family transcriptional regulator [Marinospirillum sp.]|uniref:TetR/AcrR family transcriptional regulator n=1 Tax=Marinospirillum sp. TaxID=2183934 RepID=UPI002B46965F|nr:TetR family transcriptional regulator [Marinospirillum sp.]HKM14416.1 TetR family transcriptional regulator [Marinospirillum sp.]
MAQSDTVVRILDTAEALFAEKGFAETSLRTITSRAKVNLAAVNYHFGSKKALIQAVFARYLDPFCEAFNTELAVLENKQQTIPLEELLAVMARTTLNVPATKGSLSVFMRLLGLAYTQAQGHMRRYLQENYGQTFLRFTHLLKLSSADLPDAERFWRLHFILGAVVFTMSSLDALRDIALNDYDEKTRIADLVARLLPVVTAAMQAPVPVQPEKIKSLVVSC